MNFKRFLKLACIPALALSLYACSDDDDPKVDNGSSDLGDGYYIDDLGVSSDLLPVGLPDDNNTLRLGYINRNGIIQDVNNDIAYTNSEDSGVDTLTKFKFDINVFYSAYDYTYRFCNGMAKVLGTEGTGIAYLRGDQSEVITEGIYSYGENFASNGYTVVSEDDLTYTYINYNNINQVDSVYFNKAYRFSTNGLALVKGIVDSTYQGYSFINESGDTAFTADYPTVYSFSDNFAVYINDDGMYGVLNSNGKDAFDTKFAELHPGFFNGLCAAKGDNDLWGFINTNGFWVIDPIYEQVGDFISSYAWVADRGGVNYNYIDQSGNKVFNTVFDAATTYYNGFACVKLVGETNYKFIDEDGEVITTYTGDDVEVGGEEATTVEEPYAQLITPMIDGIATVLYDNDEFGYVNALGTCVWRQAVDGTSVDQGDQLKSTTVENSFERNRMLYDLQ